MIYTQTCFRAMSSHLMKVVPTGRASMAALLSRNVSRSMSIQAKVLKYTSRGGAISLKEEIDTLPSTPSGSQALIRFLASPVSHTDFKAIQARYAFNIFFFEMCNIIFTYFGTRNQSAERRRPVLSSSRRAFGLQRRNWYSLWALSLVQLESFPLCQLLAEPKGLLWSKLLDRQ
jgi:hypothetical protein